MFSVSLIKVKLLTILSMVFMGLFSRFVLGFPILFPITCPIFHATQDNHRFPDSGSRTSLRFMPTSRYTQKRRRILSDGGVVEEELTVLEDISDQTCFDLVNDVIEYENDNFNTWFLPLAR